MAKVVILESAVHLWLSANDTARWATRAGQSWPCSELAGHRVYAAFDRNGLYDMTIDGRDRDVDNTEFSAIMADFARPRLEKWSKRRGHEHPAYFVVCGQFANTEPHGDTP